MGILSKLFKNSPSKQEIAIEEARNYYIGDLSEKMRFLKGCSSDYVGATRKTFRLFQQVFQSRFETPLEFTRKSSEVRGEFFKSLSNALSTLESKKKDPEALGLSIFLIVLSVIEIDDLELLSQVEDILVGEFLNEG